MRCRDLIKQICDAEDVRILKGVISKDHVHLHVEYPELGKRYWGRHFWAIGYGAWSSGNITDDMVQTYLEHHRNQDDINDAFILE